MVLLLIISAIISSKAINILRFLIGLYSSIFWSMSLGNSMKDLKSLKCFRPVRPHLLIENWYIASQGSLAYKFYQNLFCWFFRLNNVFPDSDPPIVDILYRWSGISDQFGLCSFMFSFVTTSKLIIFLFRFVVLLHLISCFSLTRFSLVPYVYVCIESI